MGSEGGVRGIGVVVKKRGRGIEILYKGSLEKEICFIFFSIE